MVIDGPAVAAVAAAAVSRPAVSVVDCDHAGEEREPRETAVRALRHEGRCRHTSVTSGEEPSQRCRARDGELHSPEVARLRHQA